MLHIMERMCILCRVNRASSCCMFACLLFFQPVCILIMIYYAHIYIYIYYSGLHSGHCALFFTLPELTGIDKLGT